MNIVGESILISPSSATFPGTNGRLVFDSNRDGNHWQIYAMNTDGTNITQLTFGAEDVGEPTYSSDGSRIAFSGWVDKAIEIFIMNVDGSGRTQLTFSGKWSSQPAWSPDGQKIAYIGWNSSTEIYLMNADGSNQVPLTRTLAHEARPAWSPDGHKIAFSSNRDGYYRIYVMNVDGTNVQKLTESDGSDYQPNWSPDGHKIVFASDRTTSADRGGDSEIFVMNSDGSNVTQLTFNSIGDGDPVWSPDGKKIVFVRYDNRLYPFVGRQIFMMSADGSGEIKLTDTISILGSRGGGNWGLDWQPNLNETFHIIFDMTPTGNNTVSFDNVNYHNSDVASKQPGTYIIAANPATGYHFVKWETDGKVSVSRADSATTTCTVLGRGTLRMIQGRGSSQAAFASSTLWPWVRVDQTVYPEGSGTIRSNPPPVYGIITNPWATNYVYNATIEFTATSSDRDTWEFIEWELQGGIKITDNPLRITVQQDGYVKGIFQRRMPTESMSH